MELGLVAFYCYSSHGLGSHSYKRVGCEEVGLEKGQRRSLFPLALPRDQRSREVGRGARGERERAEHQADLLFNSIWRGRGAPLRSRGTRRRRAAVSGHRRNRISCPILRRRWVLWPLFRSLGAFLDLWGFFNRKFGFFCSPPWIWCLLGFEAHREEDWGVRPSKNGILGVEVAGVVIFSSLFGGFFGGSFLGILRGCLSQVCSSHSGRQNSTFESFYALWVWIC